MVVIKSEINAIVLIFCTVWEIALNAFFINNLLNKRNHSVAQNYQQQYTHRKSILITAVVVKNLLNNDNN